MNKISMSKVMTLFSRDKEMDSSTLNSLIGENESGKVLSVGVCTNFLGTDRYSLQLSNIHELSRYFDFIEFPASTIATLSEGEFQSLLQLVETIDCSTVTNIFPSQMKLWQQNRKNRELQEYLEHLLPRLIALRVKNIVFGSGPSRLMDNDNVLFAVARMTAIIETDILPRLRPYNVKLLIEPLNAKACNSINSVLEAGIICEAIDSDNVGIVVDSMQIMDSLSLEEDMRCFKKYIWHAHISDFDRKCPTERINPRLRVFIKLLREMNLLKSFSLECQANNIGELIAARQLVLELLDG